ncbi:MAG: protein-glutamate O-methyltransferase CheR, partial [Deltaproteobacteria bacterium]|nr:protein-glutamate O-methyltransferase CheR [Deltaproteobacteria bacterium]
MAELSDIDFEKIRSLVYEQSGINLNKGKKELVKARLGKRLREGKFGSFRDYYRYVTTKKGNNELVAMIDSISTNLTSFFREEIHFRKLREVIPAAIETFAVSGLKVWSAGCSTGEEPYSLAITLREIADSRKVDLQILATDISTEVLKTALAGVYPKERLGKISPLLLRKYFQIGRNNWSGYYRAKNEIKDIIKFRRFNLMEAQPFNGLFDVIFCRNVMIYFDKETQDGL